MGTIPMEITDNIQIRGELVLTFTNAVTGKKRVYKYGNLITTVGKESIADGLRGNETNNKGIITYCAVGTNDTAPGIGDTTLGTEIERKQIAVRSATNNQALFETFYNTSEGNGTLKEAGLFGDDASASVDSGTLFAKVAIDRTKSASDTLSLAWTIIIG